MKKFALYTFLLSSVAFAACEEDYDDWAAPQQPPYEEIVGGEGADTLGFTYQAMAVPTIDFASVGDSVVLFTDSLTLPEGSELTTYEVLVDGVEISLSADKKVSAADLQGILVNKYGRRPVERELPTRIFVYATVDGVAQTLYSDITVVAKPVAPYISTTYYLIGAPSQWDVQCTTLPFLHSGKDVYDDPVFTVTFPVADGEYWFAITDDKSIAANTENGTWDMVLGCAEGNGNNGMEGGIARRTEIGDDGSWKVVVAGDARFVRMTINMMDYTYKIEKLNFGEFIYEIGNESGWSTSHALRCPNFDGKYQGYYWMDGEYKFKPNADNWDGDWENDGEGKIADNGGPNMPGLAAGFYQIDVNLADMTYAATLVESISIIGTANGNWDTDTDLTYNQATGAWEVTTTLNAGEMKFRMNHDWAISWGGANGDGTNYGDLTQHDGANLQVAAGTYLIQLYIQHEGANKVVLTAQ